MIPSCARDAFTQPLLDNFSLQSVMEPYLQINPAVFDKSVTTMMTERKWWPDIDWRRQLFGGGNEEENEDDEGADNSDQGCQMAKFDPFLSLDCARVEGVGAQS